MARRRDIFLFSSRRRHTRFKFDWSSEVCSSDLAGTSRVAHDPLCVHAIANTPAGLMEFVRSYRSTNFGLPTKPGRVGSCITVFGACSAFTKVTACTLAKSPSDSLHQRLQQFRCLHYCSDCYRVERTSSRT